MELAGKVIVITGSTRGIGKAVAEACAREGAKVVICSRSEEAVEKTVEEFKGAGYEVLGRVCDVSREGDLEDLFNHTVGKWGKIDVWVNNAGISGGLKPLQEMNEREIEVVVDTNLMSVLKACKLVIPYFREHRGVIINLSGWGGRLEAAPYATTYGATKAGVVVLTRSLAGENRGYPISIHAVMPGMVDTDLVRNAEFSPTLKGRRKAMPYVLKALAAKPEDVAKEFVKIAAQEPGRRTGRVYSLLKGRRLVKAVVLMLYYMVTGKIRRRMF